MHNLIYLSTTSTLLSQEELVKILTKSRINNTSLDITGLLLYNEGSILQILEGEKEVICKLYDTIKTDPRHKGMMKLIDCPIEKRNFQDWSMGFKQITSANWSDLSGYFSTNKKDIYNQINEAQSAVVVKLVKSFVNVNNL